MLRFMFAGKISETNFYRSSWFCDFSDAKNMARDVHNILIDIAQQYGDMNVERASAFVKELTQKGRYSQDVWS